MPQAPTGIYFVTHGPKGHVFTYRRQGSAASLMTPADLKPELITGASFLHASGISQAISASAARNRAAAMAMARAAGVSVSFDTNFRPRLWTAEQARPVIEAAAARGRHPQDLDRGLRRPAGARGARRHRPPFPGAGGGRRDRHAGPRGRVPRHGRQCSSMWRAGRSTRWTPRVRAMPSPARC